MSTKVENAIKNSKPKGGNDNKKHQQPGAAAAAAAQLPDECDWRTIYPNDVTVAMRGQGADAKPEIIRRSKDGKGQYVHPSKDKSGKVLMTTTAAMRLSTLSLLAGAGNVGTGKEYKFHHGNCYFSIGLGVGNLGDGVDRPGLVETQRAYLARTNEIAQKLLGDLFDLKPQTWLLPIDRALDEARAELFGKFEDENGEKLENALDMPAVEEANPKAKKMVNDRGRELFIKRARRLPGAIVVENGVPRDPMAWVRRKVWPFANYDSTLDKMSQEQGPSVQKFPIDMAHWPAIYNEITDPKGKMRRTYQPLQYVDNSTGKALPRPDIELPFETRDPNTGKLRTEKRTVPDPFWDPCLKAPNGKLKESLVCTKLVWSLFRGPLQSGDNYGIHLKIAAPITIVLRVPRKEHIVLINETYATGMDNDNEEEEEAPKKEDAKDNSDDDDDSGEASGEKAAGADDDKKKKEAAEAGNADDDGYGEGKGKEMAPERSAAEIAREDDGFDSVLPNKSAKKRKSDEEEKDDEEQSTEEAAAAKKKKDAKRARQAAPPADEDDDENEQPKQISKKNRKQQDGDAEVPQSSGKTKKRRTVVAPLHNDLPDDATGLDD